MNLFLTQDDPEKRCIGKRAIAALADDDQVQGGDDKHALVTRSNRSDKVAGSVPAQTDVAPIFALPRDIQHLFYIDLAGSITGCPIKPKSHTKHRVRITAMEQFFHDTARNNLAVTIFPIVENKDGELGPLSGTQFETAGK